MNSNLTILTFYPTVLNGYIEAFKIYHFTDSSDVFLIPKGIFELVFQSQNTFHHQTNYSSGWTLRPRNFIGGLHSQSYYVNSGSKENYCIVVEFKPNTARYFIPERLNLYKNATIDINDVWGNAAQVLSNKIDQAKDFKQKVRHIESFLVERLNPVHPSIIDESLREAYASNGFIEIAQLSKNAALSPAQFRKRFNEEVGMSPSQYSKVIRINTSLQWIKSADISMTELTYSLGYFDQSHFIKDFKSIIGISPKKYQKMMLR